MRRHLSREVLIVTAVAAVAATAGAAGMYGFLEFEHRISPAPLSGSYSNLEMGRLQVPTLSGSVFIPYLNATIVLNTPTSFDPQNVEITVLVPADSLILPDGARVSNWTMHYDPNTYPHWIAEGYDNTGHYYYWSGLTAAFVNPDGGVVGTFNTSLLSASSIDSGALMTVTFPPKFSRLAADSVALSYDGYTGEQELADR